MANAHRWVHRTGGRFELPTVEHDNEVLVPAFLVDTLVPQGGDGGAAVSGAIEVLLSTYNGERYLPQLLESIWHQNHPDVALTVRDDGSSEGTLAVSTAYCRGPPPHQASNGRPPRGPLAPP